MRLPAISRTPGVRQQLMLLIAALIVPLLAVVVILIVRINASERQKAQESVQHVARTLALAVDTEFARSVTALQILAQSAAFTRGDMEAIRRRMGAARDQHGSWATLVLIAADGRRLINLRVPPGQPIMSADDKAWRKALADRRPQSMEVVRSPTSGLPAAGVVVPVVVNGEPTYVLMATLEAPNWSTLLARDLPPGWIAAVDDRSGITIARSEGADQLAGQPAPKALLALYAAQPSGMARIQMRDGRDAYAGFQASSLTGWHTSVIVPAEMVDGPLQQRLASIVAAAVVALIAAMLVALWASRPLSRGIRSLATAVRGLREDAPVDYRPGNVREVDEVGRAIAAASADLRQLRVDLAERAQTAEEASHLKDRFLGLLGHELRNPLAAISGANDVIARHTTRDDVRRMSAIIDRQSRHLAYLLNELLNASPMAGPAMEAGLLDLADVLREAHASREAAGALRDYEVHVVTGTAPVVGDRERLLDAIGHLLDNAIRYTPPGGTITAVTRSQGEWAVCEVRDTGQGMDDDLLKHAFKPFTQGPQPAHQSKGGVGLGLATVRHVVEGHAGSVRASSPGPGLGATFVVRMPLAHLADAPFALAPPAEAEGMKPLRVAVVEDNADVRESLVERLRQKGHMVRSAANGEAGFALLSAERFDVALVDIGLPGIDGTEMARRAIAAGSQARFVALTGYSSAEVRARATRAGFTGFIVKPARDEDLRAALSPPSSSRPVGGMLSR